VIILLPEGRTVRVHTSCVACEVEASRITSFLQHRRVAERSLHLPKLFRFLEVLAMFPGGFVATKSVYGEMLR